MVIKRALLRWFRYWVVCLLCGSATAALGEPLSLSVDTNPATAGYFVLSWTESSATAYTLQQSSDENFSNDVVEWQLHDVNQFTHSGLPTGEYFFRVRNEGQYWSEPLAVAVKHHSLNKALGFFLAGFVLFVVLLVIIFKPRTN